MEQRYKTGDEVRVIHGEHKGKRAVISYRLFRGSNAVVIKLYNGNETVKHESQIERASQWAINCSPKT